MVNILRGLFVACFLVFYLIFPSNLQAFHIPQPTGYVNDFAQVLTQTEKVSLEDSLRSYEQKTTNEIVVVTVQNLGGDDINDFTVRVFEEWKIGKKGENNGILFLAAIEDREMRIEVGYGLEYLLTDSQAGAIIRDVIAPEFRKENYYQGINLGVQKIQEYLDRRGALPGKERFSPLVSSSFYSRLILPFSVAVYTLAVLFLMIISIAAALSPLNKQNNSPGDFEKRSLGAKKFAVFVLIGALIIPLVIMLPKLIFEFRYEGDFSLVGFYDDFIFPAFSAVSILGLISLIFAVWRQERFQKKHRSIPESVKKWVSVSMLVFMGGLLGILPKMLIEMVINTGIEIMSILFVIGFAFGVIYLFSYMARSKSIWLGGIMGAILGLLLGIIIGGLLILLAFIAILGGLGLLLDYILSRNFQKRKAHGLPTDFWSSGGGFIAEGVMGGSRGFGGGSSGGGGASGRW